MIVGDGAAALAAALLVCSASEDDDPDEIAIREVCVTNLLSGERHDTNCSVSHEGSKTSEQVSNKCPVAKVDILLHGNKTLFFGLAPTYGFMCENENCTDAKWCDRLHSHEKIRGKYCRAPCDSTGCPSYAGFVDWCKHSKECYGQSETMLCQITQV